MTMSARSTGFRQLDVKLDALKGVARDDALLAAFTAGAQPVADAARALVRERSGELHDSIDVGTRLSPAQAAQEPSDGHVRVYVGPGSLAQAITEEFGTLHEAPHPFMRPAWDAEQDTAIAEVARVMSEEVDRVARS